MSTISKLIIGTVQLGLNYGINNQAGKPSRQESLNILKRAYHSGILTLDTAEAYGDAMDLIGQYHANGEPHFEIVSKFGAIDQHLNLIENISTSLARLNIPFIYAYLFHSPSDLKRLDQFPKIFHQLEEIKHTGLVKKIGISVYTNDDFKEAIENKWVEIIQFPYNVLDNGNKRRDLLKLAKDKGKELHCRSVFLQGLFYKPINTLPEKLKPLKPYLETFMEIASEMNLPASEIALNYALLNPYIDKVLVGVDSEKQLIENIQLTSTRLTQNDLNIVDKKIDVKEEELLYPFNWN